MEEWQVEHIKTNLTKLIELTNCGTLFLTELRSKNLLGKDDYAKVKKVGLDDHERSSELYDILRKKTNSYEGLLEALLNSNQTGAASILQQGIDNPPLLNLNTSTDSTNGSRTEQVATTTTPLVHPRQKQFTVGDGSQLEIEREDGIGISITSLLRAKIIRCKRKAGPAVMLVILLALHLIIAGVIVTVTFAKFRK